MIVDVSSNAPIAPAPADLDLGYSLTSGDTLRSDRFGTGQTNIVDNTLEYRSLDATGCFYPYNNWWQFEPFTTITLGSYYDKYSFKTTTKDKVYCLTIDLPGVKVQDLVLEVDGYVLKLSATRKDTGEKVDRSSIIPNIYVPESAKANLEDGVLTVEFKEGKKEVKSIKVQYKK